MPYLSLQRGSNRSSNNCGAKAHAAGVVADEQVLGDLAGSLKFLRALPYVSSKVGVFGTCSGGRIQQS
jgi:carboxymethylenebutenolidase